MQNGSEPQYAQLVKTQRIYSGAIKQVPDFVIALSEIELDCLNKHEHIDRNRFDFGLNANEEARHSAVESCIGEGMESNIKHKLSISTFKTKVSKRRASHPYLEFGFKKQVEFPNVIITRASYNRAVGHDDLTLESEKIGRTTSARNHIADMEQLLSDL